MGGTGAGESSGAGHAGVPRAEVVIDAPLVRELLRGAAPRLADRPLERVGAGWDNDVWRLGGDLVVRLPRRAIAAKLVVDEQRWLPLLAPRLPLPVPVPVVAGAPTDTYPWPWSVVPWFAGDTADITPPADTLALAARLGSFLAALHHEAPPDAPRNPHRGLALAERGPRLRSQLARLHDLGALDAAEWADRWERLAATPPWSSAPVWAHGDLHAGNLVVSQGVVSAVIDFGDLTAGDPAVDLAVAWRVLPLAAHATLRRAYGGVDAATWRRARGWALVIGVAFLHAGLGDAAGHAADRSLARRGRVALQRVAADVAV